MPMHVASNTNIPIIMMGEKPLILSVQRIASC